MHAIASWTKFTAIPTYLQPLIGSNPGIWNTPGVNIDIDNLLTTPPKTTASDPAPSMNQLAHTGIPFSGPNYNINTASLMGPSHPTQPMARPMGMGQMGGGIGMSYGGAPRMGMQPGYSGGVPGMYGRGGVGYGTPMVGGAGAGMGYTGMQAPGSMMGSPGMRQL